MTIYTAPVEEMMFLFDNLKDNQRYKEIEKYKEINSELVKGILEGVNVTHNQGGSGGGKDAENEISSSSSQSPAEGE